MEKAGLRKKFIGDRAFYKRVMAVAVPIMIQSGISSFVSLLDNIMVGRVGTEQMSGVAIVNQLIFVFYLCIFGGLSGIGIFTAQYYGSEDDEGIRRTFRFKLWVGFGLLALAVLTFVFFGDNLISLYLKGSQDGGDSAAALNYGSNYLKIMLAGLPAFTVVQVYAKTLRECSETVVPMRAGVIALLVNLVFDYILIFGKFGFPELGVNGAPIATVFSRFVEMAVVVIWAHRHINDKCRYLKGVYKTMRIPLDLVKRFVIKGTPLLMNEALWSAGMAILTQCYSLRGLNVVAAYNISNTIYGLFSVIFFSMGDAIAIIVGQHLGAKRFEQAKDEDNKIIAFAVFIAAVSGVFIFIASFFFPLLYNTTPESKHIASQFLMAEAFIAPMIALMHTTYFTLRSGGKTIITFLFDSAFMWVVSVPFAFVLSRFTNLYVIWVFVLVEMANLIKCIIGIILVKKGMWMNNIVD
jgi:putative MATE family efflux protein